MNTRQWLLYLNVFVIATCGLIYELLAGTLASYLLGDSVTQFSWIIGIYLSALGVGAWLSRYVRAPARVFVEVELAVALVGGCSTPLLFFAFASVSFFSWILYGLVFVIGILVGLELPLLMRILRESLSFEDLISSVLTFDYIGALFASLLFPILLIPQLGLVRTSLLFGIGNAVVGLWGTWLLRDLIDGRILGLRLRGVFVLIVLVLGLCNASLLTRLAEEPLYPAPIVHAVDSPYQRIVITRTPADLNRPARMQLYLNGNLQFHEEDEYRYHEALVHPALIQAKQLKSVLILGGGDGLALREVLRYNVVQSVTLVDLDPHMTQLSRTDPFLVALNQNAFDDPRTEVINQDAMIWLDRDSESRYDAVIIDFPDPNNYALGKLYTTRFYRLLKPHLTVDGAVAIQCTSPLIARKTFWCIIETLEAAGFQVRPYHIPVPSFGVWGFALASSHPLTIQREPPQQLRYFTREALPGLFQFPADMSRVPVEVNRLDNQILVRYCDEEWNRLSHNRN